MYGKKEQLKMLVKDVHLGLLTTSVLHPWPKEFSSKVFYSFFLNSIVFSSHTRRSQKHFSQNLISGLLVI